ncbi:MAG: hypothetical protein P4L95_03630, partial [Rouxiella aceris]|uniref:hypothetical protein n=1 Tax=Rouxiella aceris TaxID=2703884 RepID=UPI002840529E
MSSPAIRPKDPKLMQIDDNSFVDPHAIRPHLAKRTFSADPSPPVTQKTDSAANDTLTPHTLTLQANGSLLFEHVSHIHL